MFTCQCAVILLCFHLRLINTAVDIYLLHLLFWSILLTFYVHVFLLLKLFALVERISI